MTIPSDKIILMIQFSSEVTSKTFFYFSSRDEVIELLLKFYEDFLCYGKNNDSLPQVKLVDLPDFLQFFYSLYDFAFLEYDTSISLYIPYGKDWFTDIIKFYFKNKSS
jgi:hypothetical protein